MMNHQASNRRFVSVVWGLPAGFLGLAVLLLPMGCAHPHHDTDTEIIPATQPAEEVEPNLAAELGANLEDVTVEGWEPSTLEQAMALLDDRQAWEDHGRPVDVPRHPAEKHLKGWVFVLDPGHGGRADAPGYKRGPTGVREAEMNLRTAKLLQKLLEDAGAFVFLTRESEVSDIADDRVRGTLRMRAEMANNLERPEGSIRAGEIGADVFISIHYNASSNPDRNFTSMWFHGEADWTEVGLDLAKYTGHAVGQELRTQVALTGILMSDQQMYAGGFGVIRHSQVPAFLTEMSFFSNPVEEQRLRDAGHNLRAAYGLYRGLCEYAYGGRPTQSLPQAKDDGDGMLTVSTVLNDGLPGWWGSDRLRTLTSTLSVYWNDQRVEHTFDRKTKRLTVRVPVMVSAATQPEDAGPAMQLRVHHANMYKHHNWPQRFAITPQDDGGYLVTPMRPINSGTLAPSAAFPAQTQPASSQPSRGGGS